MASLSVAPQPMANEIVMASSGVTCDRRHQDRSLDRLKAMEKDFNLKLVFALKNGATWPMSTSASSMPPIHVVLNTLSEGPLLLEGTAGNYQVNANYRGNVKRRTVAVGATRQEIDFRWSSE